MLLCKKMTQLTLPNSTIFEAENGQIALDILANETIDLLLLDIQMPVKNGYETTLEIRQNKSLKNLPIIALTAGILSTKKKNVWNMG